MCQAVWAGEIVVTVTLPLAVSMTAIVTHAASPSWSAAVRQAVA